jgi:hypothetical protein
MSKEMEDISGSFVVRWLHGLWIETEVVQDMTSHLQEPLGLLEFLGQPTSNLGM